MKRRDLFLLFLLGLTVNVLVAGRERYPGYMDAEYYFATGLGLARGEGFSEPFLWNYLGEPEGLPTPSHAYWMPLTSLLAAAGMALAGAQTFAAARGPFLLLAASLPPLTAALGYTLSRRRRVAWLAGLWAAFPAFYAPFLVTTDAFAPAMVLGGLFFLCALRGLCGAGIVAPRRTDESPRRSVFFILGLLAGALYLARADGLLWLFVALLAAFGAQGRGRWRAATWAVAGWVLLALPWMARNLAVFGTLFAPGGARALWWTRYDELFAYPAARLTFARWWASGLTAILQARLWALGLNLQTALAVQGEIFLLPLIALAAWVRRDDRSVRLGALAWLLTLTAMTLVFPYAGARGGFFHSGAALQPLGWALAALGLERLVDWGARARGWNAVQAWRVFSAAGVFLALALTAFIVQSRTADWGAGQRAYERLESRLRDLGIPADAVVIVNDPPGFYLASGRPAIVIPDGDTDTLLAAARRYGARYVILEANHPRGLNTLFENPAGAAGLQLLWRGEEGMIFEVLDG